MLATEIIRAKRDGQALGAAHIEAFVRGLVDGSWGEGQIAALAMAIVLKGMTRTECVMLTQAMTHSGQVLQWADAGIDKPVLDKHSTGGVGDKLSLMLAPIVAACGGLVPMISGRGLGHTGGTLDKLQALPGYQIHPARAQLLQVLREAGCAIIGAGADLAPADQRLYAVRDVTATVESVPLITASILSKKLAAGLQGLVLDVKLGNGAFMPQLSEARALSESLVQVAAGAGLPAVALITDMHQVLGHSVGNALEVQEAIDFLTGKVRDPRVLELTLTLAARMLAMGGLAGGLADSASARAMAEQALDSGRAAEAFARMVAGLGGPHDVLSAQGAGLPTAAVQLDVLARRDGILSAMDTRAIGLALVALGGGRRLASDGIDASVGFSQALGLGSPVRAGQPLLRVHARDAASAEAAQRTLAASLTVTDRAPPERPLIHAEVRPT